MSVIPIQPQGPPILPGGTSQEDPAIGINAALRAFRIAAENCASEKSGAEAKDWAMAALNFAQAIIVLDPSLSQGGTPLAHDIAIKSIEADTQKQVAAIQGETQVQVEHVRGEHALGRRTRPRRPRPRRRSSR
jgi:hypothetical protein